MRGFAILLSQQQKQGEKGVNQPPTHMHELPWQPEAAAVPPIYAYKNGSDTNTAHQDEQNKQRKLVRRRGITATGGLQDPSIVSLLQLVPPIHRGLVSLGCLCCATSLPAPTIPESLGLAFSRCAATFKSLRHNTELCVGYSRSYSRRGSQGGRLDLAPSLYW